MKIEKDESVRPVCPHCNRKAENLVTHNEGHMTKHYIYCCPHCHKILGV